MNQDIAAPASPTAGGSDLSETGWFRELEDHLDCAGGLREDDEFSTVTVGLIRLALDAIAAQQARIRQLEEAMKVLDGAIAACPINRGASLRNCPKCHADRSEGCFLGDRAANDFIRTARSILSSQTAAEGEQP